ncbi:MAG: MerR family transcriptional regulator [Bacteroidota bacterium]
MKIGDFSQKFQITKETVRYYTDIGLLTPVKYRNYYDYNHSCEKEILLIHELKTMDFSINEIIEYFTIYRFSNENSEKLINYRKKVFNEKLESLQAQRGQLDKQIECIEKSLASTKAKSPKQRKFGVPLQFLNQLTCPKCNKPLVMKTGNIEENTITKGEFVCDCGFKTFLKEGILIFDGAFLENFEETKPELTDKPISTEYATCASTSTNWIIEQIKKQNPSQKIIYDVRTMSGTFGNRLIDECVKAYGSNFTYIAMDPDYLNLVDFKDKLFEREEVPTIIMLCGAYENIPIKKPFADFAVSFLGFQALSIYRKELPEHQIRQALKKHGKWFGLFFCAEKLMQINEKYSHMKRYLLKTDILNILFQGF